MTPPPHQIGSAMTSLPLLRSEFYKGRLGDCNDAIDSLQVECDSVHI